MAKKNTAAPKDGLLNTVANPTDITNPEAPALRMPDPNDPVRRVQIMSALMKKLRGGRQSTIMSEITRRLTGNRRTAGATEKPYMTGL